MPYSPQFAQPSRTMVSSPTISAADERKVWHRGELAATDGKECHRVTERTENKRNRRWELSCTFGGDESTSRPIRYGGLQIEPAPDKSMAGRPRRFWVCVIAR